MELKKRVKQGNRLGQYPSWGKLDNIKWEQFKDKLEIWDKSKLPLLGIKI